MSNVIRLQGEVRAKAYPDDQKRCPTCRETKPVAEFYPNLTGGTIYRSSRCRICDSRAKNNRKLLKLARENGWRIHVAEYERGEKACGGCGAVLPVDEFQEQISRSRVGSPVVYVVRASRCRSCHNSTSRASYCRVGRKDRRPPRLVVVVAAPEPDDVADDYSPEEVCVCGDPRVSHTKGRGKCGCGKCPAFFERSI